MTEFALHGHDLFGEVVKPKASGPVAERFTLPPFTVRDAKSGDWMERKRAWQSLGMKSEVGRDAKAYNDHEWQRQVNGRAVTDGDGTSIFDPVLCELAYRWFCGGGGAGG